MNELKHALRSLAKSPGFTAVAVLSLALGIGANTAIFSGLNALLLRALPVHEPQQLRLINWVGRSPRLTGYNGPGTMDAPDGRTAGTSFSYPAYCALRDGGTLFSSIFAFSSPHSVVVVGHGEPATASAILVSGNYFSGYGVAPLIGRPLLPDDDRPDAAPVAVITHRWWKQHCGANPEVVGQPVTINQNSFTVVGVLPSEYLSPVSGDSSDVYVPISVLSKIWPGRSMTSPDDWWVQVMGRLAPGADEVQAQAGLSVVFRQVLPESKAKMEEGGILLEDGSRGQLILRRQLAKPFYALAAAVGLVLLIACANLAGLLLARGAAREHEFAVRAAMGAGRLRLVRESLLECLLIAFAGAVLGMVLAIWSEPALLGILGAHASPHDRYEFHTDARVLLFTFGVTTATALIFGVLPALRASRVDPAGALKTRTTLGTPRLHLGRTLVAAQVCLSVLLVVGAGLMIRTFAHLAQVKPGFDPENVLLFRIRPGDAGYREGQLLEVYDRIRTALAGIPGAQAVTYSSFPLASGSSSSDTIELPTGSAASGQRLLTQHLDIGDDFFRTMKIPLLLGRDFSPADTASSLPVVIVNETFARRFFPGESAVGRRFFARHPASRVVEIVGIVGDAKYNRIRADIAPVIYFSQRQNATGTASFAVRSVVPPSSLLPALRRVMAGIDPNLPLSTIRTQQDVLDQSVASDRLFALLGAALASLAVLLSCIGVYGLLAYNVARRTSEFGIRMALGAQRADIARPIVREALLLAGAGLAIGAPVALALVQIVKSQLYGVQPNDPLTFAASAVLLPVVAALAAWLPARRASRVNPIDALRAE